MYMNDQDHRPEFRGGTFASEKKQKREIAWRKAVERHWPRVIKRQAKNLVGSGKIHETKNKTLASRWSPPRRRRLTPN